MHPDVGREVGKRRQSLYPNRRILVGGREDDGNPRVDCQSIDRCEWKLDILIFGTQVLVVDLDICIDSVENRSLACIDVGHSETQ